MKQTPCDVIDATDITFSCVSDPQAAKDVSIFFSFVPSSSQAITFLFNVMSILN